MATDDYGMRVAREVRDAMNQNGQVVIAMFDADLAAIVAQVPRADEREACVVEIARRLVKYATQLHDGGTYLVRDCDGFGELRELLRDDAPPTAASEAAPEPVGESAADPLGWQLAKGPDQGEWTIVDGGDLERYAIFSGRDAEARARLYLESLHEPAPTAASAPDDGLTAASDSRVLVADESAPEGEKLPCQPCDLGNDWAECTCEALSDETVKAAMAATSKVTRMWREKLAAEAAAEQRVYEECARIADEVRKHAEAALTRGAYDAGVSITAVTAGRIRDEIRAAQAAGGGKT